MHEELDKYFNEASKESFAEAGPDSHHLAADHNSSHRQSSRKTRVYLYFILFIISIFLLFLVIKNNFFSDSSGSVQALNSDSTVNIQNSERLGSELVSEKSDELLDDNSTESISYSNELLKKLGIINKLPTQQGETSQIGEKTSTEDKIAAEVDNLDDNGQVNINNSTFLKDDKSSDELALESARGQVPQEQKDEQNDYLITPLGLANQIGRDVNQQGYVFAENLDSEDLSLIGANDLKIDEIIYLSNDLSKINNSVINQQNPLSIQETSRLELTVSNLDQEVKDKKLWTVQLAAFKSIKEAKLKWRNMLTDKSQLVDGYIAYIETNEDKTIYRLRIGEFNSYDLAKNYCSNLQNNQLDCFVIGKFK